MNPWLTFFTYALGLALLGYGIFAEYGLPLACIVIGAWLVIQTIIDVLIMRLRPGA